MPLKLGLIGDNIANSSAPLLHRLAGQQRGLEVRYDRLVPKEINLDFEQVFERCKASGYRGINITYPYKERVVQLVALDDPFLQAMGAVNTVVFGDTVPRGYNTDYSGFMDAYRAARGKQPTGAVMMVGTGGVGRAVAFGLAALGVRDLRLVDCDMVKADALGDVLRQIAPSTKISVWDNAENAAQGAAGVVNCSPVGMVGYGGTPLAPAAMSGAEWAFDAVYTPINTQFLTDASDQGVSIISGWELFFYQGVHAWRLFSGTDPDEHALRQALNSQ
ncbi:shikimate dehydrogenase [Litoreibacter meonggei]|uniref:Shikimate dehydrogenase n=1 Tax=Litoreibacter meonggei TaxID=1049199 RepID=A0A497WSW5_9RHOB|nr:shikimate dehydrogenase [Litoreibacter meonggei]RLJ59908.1 shikimate dehydrogenase [Litoreibacter meonggei]